MPIATKEPLTAICRMDGVIVAVSPALISFAEQARQNGNGLTTLTELTKLIDGPGLSQRVEEFAASMEVAETFSCRFRSGEGQVSLQKLGQKPDVLRQEPMILISLNFQSDADREQDLLRAGRLTSQLVHDFKNQIGGIKLYAAYLKKRIADSTEGLEIAEKIVQGLNAMAEQASMVGKLTRPLELNLRSTDLVALLNQTISDCRARAEACGVRIDFEPWPEAVPLAVDAQQLRSAFGALIARAVDASAENGCVVIRLQRDAVKALIEVIDQGEGLSDEQRQKLFELPPGEKINQTSLSLAIARRVIDRHGGGTAALASADGGTMVQVRIPM